MFFPLKEIVKEEISKDAFFDRLTSFDLVARQSHSTAHYKKKYSSSIIDFNPEEKVQLEDFVNKADIMTKRYKKVQQIPWKFVKLSPGIEQDYPHTLQKYIMLPYNFISNTSIPLKEKVKTLIHEKIHVFQRTYPTETRLLIRQYWGFRPVCISPQQLAQKRTNPDTDENIYERNSKTCLQEYKTDKPNGLHDSHLNRDCIESYEHPFEQMAYILSDILVEGKLHTNDHISALKWLYAIHQPDSSSHTK